MSNKNEYKIVYRDKHHWSPESPRIVDMDDEVLAICEDIECADIILRALNTRAEQSSTLDSPIECDMKVGAGIFRKGVTASTVLLAAGRNYQNHIKQIVVKADALKEQSMTTSYDENCHYCNATNTPLTRRSRTDYLSFCCDEHEVLWLLSRLKQQDDEFHCANCGNMLNEFSQCGKCATDRREV